MLEDGSTDVVSRYLQMSRDRVLPFFYTGNYCVSDALVALVECSPRKRKKKTQISGDLCRYADGYFAARYLKIKGRHL